MQNDAAEDDGADQVVAQEGGETPRRLAVARQPLVPHHHEGGARDGQVVPEAELCAKPDEHERCKHDDLQTGNDKQVDLAEQDCRGLDADLDVVFAIAHCVERVVDHGPDQGGAEYEPGKLRRLPRLRGERHGHGPAERRAENELRYRHVALDERIHNREDCADDRQLLRVTIQHRGETDSDQTERQEKHQRLHRRDGSRCNRSRPGALDVGIDLAVDPVVQHAAGRAHDEDTEDKDNEKPLVRMPVTGKPQSPEAWPKQQVDADRLVDAHELAVITQLRDELGRED